MKNAVILFLLIGALVDQNVFGQKLTEKKVRKIFTQSEILQEHFVGFILQEEAGSIVYAQHDNIHFVPASNTKLLTLLAGLVILEDSIPAFQYEILGDSLILWPTGDPSFLHPKLDNGRVYHFLAETPYQIYIAEQAPINYEPSYWRSDPAHFPIYANTVNVKGLNTGFLEINPKVMIDFVKPDSSLVLNEFDILRDKTGNLLKYPILPVPEDFEGLVPFPMDLEMSRFLLQDTLKREVQLTRRNKGEDLSTFYSIPSDSLYKHMMQPSDNFLAEQVLLLCSGTLGDTLDIQRAIGYVQENGLRDLRHPPIWEDGSGLSRYNLFTPNTVLAVLNMLEERLEDIDRLKALMPAGGVSGTLKTAYALDRGETFVWAKTGSLKNMHLQSGWLETRKGKRYRFVFMNNNFVRPTAEVRKEMVRIITHIREKF
jgi:D-alanyl-D-alanine carboxypeptidase/D-alanyl-D-alanine-endopeptidase (penicillin-binding protein 4)